MGTDSEYEPSEGRIALWLDPEDIAFLADQWRLLPQDIERENADRWNRIAFRAMSCLHHHNVKYEPKSASNYGYKYKIDKA